MADSTGKSRKALLVGAMLGGLAYVTARKLGPVLVNLVTRNPVETLAQHHNAAPPGTQTIATEDTAHYTMQHVITDGIERISYLPRNRRYDTPIVFQHGMWHGAWAWQPWQALLAEWGWESHAHSLPGHAGSPAQRAMTRITLDYYLGFLRDEIERQSRPPILIGHSMGGALLQWYLKFVGDLPAAVGVAGWISPNNLEDMPRFLKLDTLGVLLCWKTETADPFVRNPIRAARLLLGPDTDWTPEALHSRLGSESVMVMLQHNAPFWKPPAQINTPLLWVAAEADAAITPNKAARTAAHYGADFQLIPNAGHNLMMERRQAEIIRQIHDWLVDQHLP